MEQSDPSGKVVFEADQIAKSFGATTVIRDFSTRIIRGDRVGLIGPNGAGKTTLLRILLGEIEPDRGEVRRGVNVQVAYYDQQREQLDPERTVLDTVGGGNDTVTVSGRSRHIMGYLQDFLFAPERARSPVKALSGGERNRLLLARLFTKPANVLVLDEPTNDLDLETLELVEAQLVDWPGTLLLVSHDRRFLDNVVTSTIAFEGGGRVAEYVGGYEDWLRQRPQPTGAPETTAGQKARVTIDPDRAEPKRKLTFNEQRELARLPSDIAQLEAELKELEVRSHAADFYKEGGETIVAVLERIGAITERLLKAYARWDALDSVGK
jgi:ATP-binding cassette subfamily F protein uup